MATAMYVIREMEDALDDCANACPDCNGDGVNALDEAVAFYTGSLEDGSGSGVQMYSLAEKRCINFKTCGANGDSVEGMSKVNLEIFKDFTRMQQQLATNQCVEARKIKERIVNRMFIPLIQGTLRYAWKRENEVADQKAEAEGATFAAAVLPMVNSCSEGDAATIYSNMRPGSGTPNFQAVKNAFENNYGCLKISSAEVGGLYDAVNNRYYEGAAPSSSGGVNVGLAVGVSIGVVVALALIGLFIARRRRKSEVEFKSELEFKNGSTTENDENHQI